MGGERITTLKTYIIRFPNINKRHPLQKQRIFIFLLESLESIRRIRSTPDANITGLY